MDMYANMKDVASTKPSPIELADAPARGRGGFVFAAMPGLYIWLVLAAALLAGAYGLRAYGIFRCPASGYGSDGYVGYCNTTSYGDYDHGAFWFGLEPAASAAAANAQVLFVGNSRIEFAFSTQATADWFSSLPASYYLLGFTHFENYTFEAPLLRTLRPKAKVYVINIDSFFDRSETPPGKTVMRNEAERKRYEQKRNWQAIQKAVCTTFPLACRNGWTIFRSRGTGTWHVAGAPPVPFTSVPISYDDDVNQDMLASYTLLGNEFLPSLPADRNCTILTIVPAVKTGVGTAKAVAASLGLSLVAPRLDGLTTFDGIHLEPKSAQRWSAAFLEEAGPQIRKCLSN